MERRNGGRRGEGGEEEWGEKRKGEDEGVVHNNDLFSISSMNLLGHDKMNYDPYDAFLIG